MVERVSGRASRDKVSANGDGGRRAERVSPSPRKKPFTKKTIALVYDFDGTLSPKPMQEYAFLPKLGVKAEDFWAECTRVAKAERADPLITYMHLMYKKAKEKGLRVDRKDLVAQGRDVELYPGVETWFAEIAAYVKEKSAGHGVTLKHYLVSSGLTEIIEGTKIYKNFANVFASEYWFDAYDLPFPKRVITDTGKTQYLFRINKGIEDLGESINSHMAEDARPIPFSNMIYFGDGDTDVPSMALLKKNGGHAIAVHTPLLARSDSASRSRARPLGSPPEGERAGVVAHGGVKKCVDLFNAGRCDFYAGADYRKNSDLFKRTCLLLDRIIADIRVQEERSGLGG
ncbi:MAG: HAD family hydrolase [Hyphomicrobium sp.]